MFQRNCLNKRCKKKCNAVVLQGLLAATVWRLITTAFHCFTEVVMVLTEAVKREISVIWYFTPTVETHWREAEIKAVVPDTS